MGLVTGQDLTYVLREQLRHHPWSRALVLLLLVLYAMGVCDAAYEAGWGWKLSSAWKAAPPRST